LRDSIVPWSVTVCGKANKASSRRVGEGVAPLKRDRARAAAREKQLNEQKWKDVNSDSR